MSDDRYPPGVGFVSFVGMKADPDTGEEYFAAEIRFPNGPPPLKTAVVFHGTPVTIQLSGPAP